MPSDYDHTGSILTPTQRRFLWDGPSESQGQTARRMTKSRIRNRLGAAIIDFSMIFRSDYFDVEDIEEAFTAKVDMEFEPIPAKLIDEAIAVLFIGALTQEDDFDKTQTTGKFIPKVFFEQVAGGVEHGFTRMGRTVKGGDINISFELDEIQAERADSTELHERSMDQLDRLRLAKEIDEHQYINAVLKKYRNQSVDDIDLESEF